MLVWGSALLFAKPVMTDPTEITHGSEKPWAGCLNLWGEGRARCLPSEECCPLPGSAKQNAFPSSYQLEHHRNLLFQFSQGASSSLSLSHPPFSFLLLPSLLHIKKYSNNEIFLAIKNEVMLHVTTWMDLENIIVSKKSQPWKTTYCMISFMRNVQNRHI